MPLFILPLVLAASFHSVDQIPPIDRGTDLYQRCKNGFRADSEGESAQGWNDLIDGAACEAYVHGFVDGDARQIVCSAGASYGTMERVYVSYMDQNPKLLDEYKSVGLHLALANSYPCAKGK